MQSPCPLFPGLIDMAALIFQRADKAVLFAKIANAKAQMMCQRREIDFHIHGERFITFCDGHKGLSLPKGTASEHRQNHLWTRSVTNPAPEIKELWVGDMVEGMRMTCAIDPLQMITQDIGALAP